MPNATITTHYSRNGYTDHSRNGNKPMPQDRLATAHDVVEALKLQTPDVQDAVVQWAASQSEPFTIATMYARIGRERKNHPVTLGALVSA